MKKMLILVAILLVPVAAMAGMTAFDNMTELDGADMASCTGQVGITIDTSVDATIGYVAWGDGDGVGTTYSAGAYLSMNTITVDDNGSAMTINGLTIDAGSDGTDNALVIGLPTITGDITIASITIGTAAGAGTSLGSLTISDVTMTNSTVVIKAH